ncbi:Fe-S cluster assembly ATPase SufC [Candidatus Roizmanbacteria bacterium RIFCSPHIGHO2_02_FULL_37_13b]|uniref:Fe-S cluster assembly ATPase SufC n=1 Tax=Candidatus Roizmanbacteria bacterium RIFCSPLOWO2_02_FULL_36_11 TaxID=1802071 RepID=A0A1F7JCC1_9BACT|nr:MAG: Fe-S cluster assembly ATPase SufC [Candidatus Roizmanbacteria bacterium RIFCSPHIGHO2_02_FULL_37_13b]OGK53267.1 MAG: Fe-S cluster assembly ATPase SufC [Candidatus Roizmanbacteria bacterium RIFCSPLOWO2_02_FULL_36_11]
MLKISNLSVFIDKKKVLDRINYNFEENKVYCIMGPNGSGKSTLAAVIMGHPAYSLGKSSRIEFEGKNITDIATYKRANKGIFLTFQTPMSLSGVNIFQLARFAKNNKLDPRLARQKIVSDASKLKINEELLSRSLNDNFSGGEKKKMEVLQASMLNPKFIIFDEIDTGVDVDSMRTIAKFIDNTLNKKGKTIVLITHYNRILRFLKPDRVLILVSGRLVKIGDHKLAERIEKEGYDKINSNVKIQNSKKISKN